MTDNKEKQEKTSAIKKVDIKQDNSPLNKKEEKKNPNIALRILMLLILFLAGSATAIYFLPTIAERVPYVAGWLGQNNSVDVATIQQQLDEQQQTINDLTRKSNEQQSRLDGLSAIDVSILENRMDALEAQISPAASETIETNTAAPVDTSQAARIDMLLSRMSQLEASFVPLSKNMLDAAEAEKERATLQSETAALSEKITILESRLVSLETESARDNSGLLLNMKIAELKRKVISGESFAVELATVKRLTESSTLAMNDAVNGALDQLSNHASTGLPTPADLKGRFTELIPEIMATPTDAQNASWWQSTMTRLQNMITVRRTGELTENDGSVESLIAQIEAWIDGQDFNAVLEALSAMPSTVQNLLSTWKEDLEIWLYGEEAIETLESIAAESYLAMNSYEAVGVTA
ncbi:COG4223 family protein [Pseudemcibacter aquimaris]|uniref:COG4223 family protein n=1 Tax=Pseudemcibacter aquimaris TaxID=2857064 RepID=UPI002012C0B8|nr:hypothetical protein [Pseudemcibacter aquimaris]MCC3861869.1 hypothetical protein [Pseudemcibacter aquimaris]WDU58622.1 hypothetical protein KW060_15680 [Pseudemcibacter aquimaris]